MSANAKIAGMLCGIALCGLSLSATTHGPKKSAAPKPQVVQPAPQVAPVIPAPPPTPEQMPATPPRVTMNAGQLSITAENSTLGDVLGAVKKLTGAGVEIPNSATAERVVVHLGPGNPQEVLQQMLAGSKFDYIILGSPDSSAAIQKIILTQRGAAGAGSGPVTNAANQPPRGGYQAPPPDYSADNGSVDEEIVQPEPPGPQNDVNPPEEGAQQQIIGPGGQAQQQQQQEQQQQGPKTPEQLLQELQRMQQQQQQDGGQGRPPRQPIQQ